MAPTASTRAPRSLADELRSRSAGEIRRLLALRPDLVQPWPADLSELARRAADDASVLEAMQSLPVPALRVLEVLACLHEASAEDVATGLGEDLVEVAALMADLRDRALLWGGPDRLRVVRAAQQSFGAHPCGLGADLNTRPDPHVVRQAALGMDPDRVRHLVWNSPVSTTPNPLAVTRGDQYVVPREVALILRDGRYLPPADPPPAPQAAAVAPGESLWSPLAGVRYLLADLARSPLAWHATRGVGRRQLADRAQTMHVPTDLLAAWLELALVAGLVGGADSSLRPSATAEHWGQAPPEAMWSTLIAAWLDSDRLLPRCRPDELGAGTTTGHPRTALHRRHILQCWPGGRVTADLLRAHLAWCRPRMVEAAEQSADVLAELELLGLVVGGLPTEALPALPEDLAHAASALPAPTSGGLIVQPDLTIIAPLHLDARTWTLLHEVSRVESWGPVVMHRIDPPMIRVAVGSRDPQDLLSRLAGASRTPLPQSLEYLVRDAARSRPVRLWQATLLRAGDQDAETLRDLGLDELAPGTFTSPQAVEVVRDRLERAGLGIEAVTPAEPGTPLEFPRVAGHDPRAVDRLVTRLVSSDRVDERPPALHPADPATLAATCRQAVAEGRSLWLEFREGDVTLTHLVEPLDVRSGTVSGWSLTAGRSVSVPLSRIAATGEPA